MATDWFIWSGGSDSNSGANFGSAKATVSGAFSVAAPGDRFFVAHDHAPPPVASPISLLCPGTPAQPCQMFCVDRAGSQGPADLRNSALIQTSGANAITLGGHLFSHGVSLLAGSGAVIANINIAGSISGNWVMDDCKLALGSTGGASTIALGGQAAGVSYRLELINTQVKFGAIQQGISIGGYCEFIWRDTPAAIDPAGSIPTTLLQAGATVGRALNANLRHLDLSVLGAGKTIVGAMPAMAKVLAEKCKLNGAVTKAATPTGLGARVQFLHCDSGLTNFKHERFEYAGKQSTETEITRTGTQATDKTQPVAWKIETTPNARPMQPFECIAIPRWCDTIGTVTVTVYGVWDGGVVPNDDEIWMTVSHFGDASSPRGAQSTNRALSLAETLLAGSGSALAADASVWGGSGTAFKMQATFSPTAKGLIRITIKAGKPSTTFYVDPTPVIAGQAVERAFAC